MGDGSQRSPRLVLVADVEMTRRDKDRLKRSHPIEKQDDVGALRQSREQQLFRLFPIPSQIPDP
jgi:hypothetical protein